MGLGLIYWIIWVIGLLWGGVGLLVLFPGAIFPLGGLGLVWVLLFMLGWKVFGLPISGSTE